MSHELIWRQMLHFRVPSSFAIQHRHVAEVQLLFASVSPPIHFREICVSVLGFVVVQPFNDFHILTPEKRFRGACPKTFRRRHVVISTIDPQICVFDLAANDTLSKRIVEQALAMPSGEISQAFAPALCDQAFVTVSAFLHLVECHRFLVAVYLGAYLASACCAIVQL